MLLSIWRRWLKRSWNLLIRYKKTNRRPLAHGFVRPILEELELRLNPSPYLAFTSYPTPLNNGAISTIASNSTPYNLGITLEGTSDPSNDQVHLAISGGPTGGGFLTAPADQTLASNMASWTGLEITAATAPGTYYTVTATDVTNPSIPAATMEWQVSPAAASQLAFTQGPGINTLASFNGNDGAAPYGGVTLDSNGDLFGTTEYGGVNSEGDVYEIAKGSNTITTLASFDSTNGAYPVGGVILDSNGDLFGTTTQGGVNGNGTVFEIANGSDTITTLASFDYYTNGSDPTGSIVLDSNGDLFGTTNQGGTSGRGTVYEIAYGSGTITTLASFDYYNTGAYPNAGVTMDSNGNLYGTTTQGGAYDEGTVFEVPSGSNTITTVALFNYATGSPSGGVVLDSSGNLYSTTAQGGDYGDGSVVEVVSGSGSMNILASFNGNDGQYPHGGVSVASTGNLYGTTALGGAIGSGTVYEIIAGSGIVTTLSSFNDSDGSVPTTGVTLDSTGNLYGTTGGGGAYYTGTVFELPVSPEAGQVLSPTPQVSVEDAYGNVVTSSTDAVTVSLASGPASFASGTLTVNAVNGVATFSDLVLDTAGSYTLTAMDTTDGLNPATSSSFNVNAGPASQLVLSQSPGSGTILQALNPALQVSVEDLYGNLVTTSTDTITVSAKGPGGFDPDSTTTTTVVNGLATFSNLVLDTPGTYTLTATDTANDLLSVTTSSFTVNPLLVVTQSPGTITLGSFNGSNGNTPSGNVVLDSSGNLYGTTQYGGAFGQGDVYEISKGSNTINILASFNYENGANPNAGVILDSSGDLFGTTTLGGDYGAGTVFEIAQGSDTITTLASFDGFDNGGYPYGGVVLDSNGNLYGTTTYAGDYGEGTVYELANGSGTLTTLASFNGTNGAYPTSGLVLDSNGDLFGTTNQGGDDYAGTVYEIASGSDTITTLASFNNTNGAYPYAGVTLDSNGNLFGTTQYGGSNGVNFFGYGTVYEIASGSGVITPLASFDNSNTGANPYGGVVLDSSGNLYGTTSQGGFLGAGTVYELANGSGTITNLASFDPSTGSYPEGGLTLDSTGHLYGTTSGGGTNYAGTVYVLPVPTAGQIATAGQALPAFQFSLEDASGNVIPTSTGQVTVSAEGPADFTSGTTTVPVVNGVATFSDLVLDTAGSYLLTGSDTADGLNPASTNITVSPAAPSQLVIGDMPYTTTAGQVLSSYLQVYVEDQFGNVETGSSVPVTVSVASGPGSFASGTLTVDSVNGVATFSDLVLDTAGTYTLAVSDPTDGLPQDTTSSFTVTAAKASQLAFTQTPGTTTAGQVLSPLQVSVEDQYGNVVTSSNLSVTISVASGPGGIVSGTTTVNAVNGVAAFSNLVLDTAGSYTLTASTGLYGIAFGTSASFQVSPAAATQLGVIQTPGTALLASFNGDTGSPVSGLTMDSNGNLFGTTEYGGAYGYGSIYEIASGSNTVTTLASFDFDNGAYPQVGVTLDSNGNLYGTTSGGSDNRYGTVYELTAGSSTITTLASFDYLGYSTGANPMSAVVLDSNGNIYGTTSDGGTDNDGTIYELAKESNTITPLVTFNYDNGALPWGTLVLDSSGNLYGTTASGGAYGYGTVYELPNGSTTVTTLATFDQANGANPHSGVVEDSSGNFYGTTGYGGANNDGTVFELPYESTIITTLASFNVSNIGPSGVILDSNGNLYGTTGSGGPGGLGSVFEVAKGSATITTLASFNNNQSSNGYYPSGAVVQGSSGNLYGTTGYGGTSGDGTVFEVRIQTAGQVLDPGLQVGVEDQYGNVVTDSTAPVTVSVATGPGDFASGTLTVNAVNGVATFSDLVLDTAGNYTLSASDLTDGLTPATTTSFPVSAAAGSQLQITQTPGTTTAGQELSPAYQVSVEDPYGNVVTDSNAAITVSATLTAPIADPGFETPSVGYGSFAYGPISGSPWTFSNYIADPYANGAGIAGNDSGFTSGSPSAPEGAQVAFIQGTGSISQSVNLATGSYVVTFSAAQRANYGYSTQTIEVLVDGTVVGTITPSGTNYAFYSTTAFNVSAGNHTIEFLGLNPDGLDNTAFIDQVSVIGTVAFASGTTTENAVDGVATFSDLVLNTAGTYTLTATDTADGLMSATSSSFTVSPDAVSQLVITQTPGASNVGQDLAPALQVSLEDSYGNVVTTSSANISVSVTGPADFASGTTTESTVNGVATFSDLVLDTPGTYTLTASDTADGLPSVTTTFVVNPVLVVTQSPGTTTAGQVLTPALQVNVEDGYGNLITDSNAAITVSATQTVPIADPGFETPSVGYGSFAYDPNSGSPWTFQNDAGITGNNSGFTGGGPLAPVGTQVAFIQDTGSVSQSLDFATGTYVLIVDAAQRENYGTSDQTIEVLVDGTDVGTITPSGIHYSTYSTPAFTVSAGNHTIEFLGLSPSPNDTAFIDQVSVIGTLAFASGTTTENAVNGVATFSDLVLNTPGTYTLTASDTVDGLTSVSTSSFVVNPVLVVTQSPGATTAGQVLSPALQVNVEDGYGNLVIDSTAAITVSATQTAPIADKPISFASGTTTENAVNGVATFSDLVLDPAGTYILTASDTADGLTPATSSSFTISQGAASQLAITQTPGTTNAGQELSPALQVSIEDQAGNLLADSNAAITVSATLTAPIADPGFENPSVGYGSFAYDPNSESPWTFQNDAGITGNNSGFTSVNPSAPEGTQAAFIQDYGSISQSLDFATGSYVLTFSAAQRGNYGTSNQTIEVLIDGTDVGTITPSGTNYATYSTPAFNVSAGTHTLELLGLSPSIDDTAFIDQVSAIGAITFASGTTTENTVNGVATFPDLVLDAAGTYTLTASDTADGLTTATSSSFTVSPVAANQLAFTQGPSTTNAGQELSPALQVSVEDLYGNVVTSSSATITLSVTGPGDFASETTVTAVNGVATFSDLVLDTPGTYTLTATDSADGLPSVTTTLVVNPVLVVTQSPGSTTAGQVLSPSLQVNVEDGYGNLVTDSNAAITVSATQTVPIADAGFETPSVGYGSFAYDPNSESPWTFQNDAGITGNNSGFTSGNPSAPEGAQAAFVQDYGSISQSLDFATGNYVLTFSAAQRQNYGTSHQTIEVLVDGTDVGTISPSGTDYATYSTPAFNVSAGTHTIELLGLSPSNGDTAFVDQVSVVGTVAFASGTPTENAVNGVATFSDLVLDTPGTYTLTASDTADGLTPATSSSFTVVLAPSQLGITQTPTTTIAGQELSPALQVSVEDPYGNVVTDSNAAITVSATLTAPIADPGFESPSVGYGGFVYGPISGSPWTFTPTDPFGKDTNGAGITGNNSGFTNGNPSAPEGSQVAFLEGSGSFSQSVNLGTGSYVVTFSAAQRGNYGSREQTIEVLVDGTAVGTITPSEIYYSTYSTPAFNVSAGNHTIEFLGLNPTGYDTTAFIDQVSVIGTVAFASGTTTENAVNGVATFSDLVLNTAGTYTLTATDTADGLNAATSSSFTVSPAAVSQLVITGTPGTTNVGQNLTPALRISLEDTYGNVVTTSTASITVSVTGPADFASGTTTVTAVNGVATFSDLVLDTPGTYTLTASDTADGLPSVTTSSFIVNPVLVVTQSPATTTTAGQVLSPALQVSVEDGYGNVITDSNAAITVNASQSVAISDPGFETPSFGYGSIVYGPINGSPWTFQNQAGITGNNSGFTNGNPPAPEGAQVAFIQNYGSISQSVNFSSGSYVLTVSAAQRGNYGYSDQEIEVLVDGTAVGTIIPLGPGYSVYNTPPFNVSAGNHTIELLGLDPLATDNTAFVDQVSARATVAFDSGTATENAVNGVATFSDLVLNTAGIYTLTVTDTPDGYLPVRPANITVNPATASQLVITQTPGTATAGQTLTPLQVCVEDQYGNVETGSSVPVTVSVASGPGDFASGTTTVDAVNGVATFSDLVLDTVGTYNLSVTDTTDGVPSVTTSSFTVSQAAASQLVITQTPGAATAGQGLSPALQVSVEDQYGNVETGSTASVTVSANGPGGFTSGSTTTVNAVNGVATFSNLTLDTAGSYTLLVTDTTDGVSSTTSSFTVSPAAASQLVITQSPVYTLTDRASFGSTIGSYPYTSVVLDSNGDVFSTTLFGGPQDDGTVYEIVSGSNTITTLATFNGNDGYGPLGKLAIDSSGNLYGTTSGGGPDGDGTIFEVAAGSGTITTLAVFNGTNGFYPATGLVMDSSGNLFGATNGSTSNSYGTIFELAAGSGTITTLATFNYGNGAYPNEVIVDSGDNVYGTTSQGGAYGLGTVFEVTNGSATITTLASFDGNNGEYPYSGVALDSSGNLYGTSSGSNGSYNGTMFELLAGSGTITTLATFNGGSGVYPGDNVVLDSSGNLFGTTTGGGDYGDGTVFELPAGSDTIAALTSFNGTDGYYADTGVTLDSSGDLFGTTIHSEYGGTVFEVVTGSGTVTTLASFNQSIGTDPNGNVILDQNGNLFGTTAQGGLYADGTVYEVAAGSDTITTLAAFNGTNGSYATGGLVEDGSGNLFGTTSQGGADGYGTIFELAAGSDTITTLASFDYSNTGGYPSSSLVLDSNGDLFGSTFQGGADGYGTVYELPYGSGTITALATFDGSNGSYPGSSVTLDSNGNVYGTTSYGGVNNNGTVYEVAAGSGTITTLASFNGGNPSYPNSGLVLDSSGNLFGTTFEGGANSEGTVYELAAGSGVITTLAAFNGNNGSYPATGLILDSNGNLYGTTFEGGAANEGTVYELAAGSGTLTTLASFNSTNGLYTSSGLTLDSNGDLFGTTGQGGFYGEGAVYELQPQKIAGQVLSPSLQVSVEDAYGNVVTNSTATVTVSANGPGSFAGGSTTTEAVVNGVATFSNLTLDTAGTYTLTAADAPDSLTSATTSSFTVIPAAASQLVITQTPGTTLAGQALTPFLQGSVEDPYGNVETTSTAPVTVSVASGPRDFATGSTLTVNAVNGVATFSNLTLDTAGSYTLTAADTTDGLTSATTGSFTVNASLSVAATSKATVLQNVSSGLIQLATFGQVGGSPNAANYTATVTWGDGSAGSSFGTNPTLTITVSGGVVTVFGSHTYTSAGLAYPLVTLTYEGASVSTNANTIVIDVAADVTSHTKSSASPYSHNLKTKLTTSTLTVTNTGSTSLSGEFYLVLQGLTAGVTLQTASLYIGGQLTTLTIDKTAAGDPMIVIPSSLLTSLASNQSFQVVLGFNDPNNIQFGYNTKLYSDPYDTL